MLARPGLLLQSGRGAGRGVLVLPGFLRPPLTLSRAQALGAMSTRLTADDLTWEEMAADTPRFWGSARRLLIEGQRTNEVRNPRAAGATVGVIGSGGVNPTNYLVSNSTGVVQEIVAFGTVTGVQCWDARRSGTPTAGTSQMSQSDGNNVIPAVSGQTWTSSILMALLAAPLPSMNTVRATISGTNGTSTGTETATVPALPTLTANLQRFSVTRLLNNAGTTNIRGGWDWSYTTGNPVDFTLRSGWHQLELGAFASSPILPPVGTPGASTRGADIVAAPAVALGAPPNGAFTLLWKGLLPQNAPAGTDQWLAALSDGSVDNAIGLVNPAGGATIVAQRVTATVGLASASAGSMTAGTVFRAGITCDGAGRVAASVNGGAAAAVTGAPTAGYSLFSLGALPAGVLSAFALHEYVRVLPGGVGDAALSALVAGIP